MALTIESHQKVTKVLSQKLSCSIEVMLMHTRLKSGLKTDQYEVLQSFVPSLVDTESETGWEESTLASLQFLLQHSLSQGKQS